MDHLLIAIQNSKFAYWLSQGVYPVIITLHAVGLALLVGLQAVIDLRVLGWGRGLPVLALRSYMKVVWIGFGVNAFSGTLLFLISPEKFLHSTLFILKISLIATGLVLGAVLNASLLAAFGTSGQADARSSMPARVLAILSLLCWIAAIVTGRWLAYTTFGDVGVGDDG